ncbi:hypothetical protein pipiens_011867 [Culex pipiens pipiens]|uniref:Uncharacterized protein n=1 Tax=Culex pipiens pipiens TaxID=38569 RepID=A0ABD1D5A1_CULPP
MPLLKRKLTDTSFIISIESGVEEIPEEKHPTSTAEDCDFLVNFITGEESLSASFCCKLFYTIFRVCFTTDDGPKRPPRSTYRTI